MTGPDRPPDFRPKRFGYGVSPATPRGWAMVLGLIGGLLALALIVVLIARA